MSSNTNNQIVYTAAKRIKRGQTTRVTLADGATAYVARVAFGRQDRRAYAYRTRAEARNADISDTNPIASVNL